METRTERKFLKFLDEATTPLTEEINIKGFIVSNFTKPNPRYTNTTNETDKAVNLLKGLKSKRLIEYDDIALSHVNYWYVDDPPTIKRWFDTLHEPLYVSLTDYYFTDYSPLSPRLLNKRFVLKQIKYAIKLAIKYGGILLFAIWKYLIALSLVVIGAYLALDNNLLKIFVWLKSLLVK
jgi:hypothetical protein